MKIRFFASKRGQQPVQDYLQALEAHDAAKVRAAFDDIRRRGLAGTLVSLRQIRGKLWEIKVQPHRIFYAVVAGDTLVLLHAYKKQGQKAPRMEIETALSRLAVLLGQEGHDDSSGKETKKGKAPARAPRR